MSSLTIKTVLLSFTVASLFKVFFLRFPPSTDFEVHRNWLAITHSLPLSQWYHNSTSPWTLDYPPLFAFFERFLSYFAPLFDSAMLNLCNIDYSSSMTILFQKVTVIIADFLLFVGSFCFVKTLCEKSSHVRHLEIFAFISMISFPSLLILDHVHFQYNGFLIGWFLLSFTYLLKSNSSMTAFFFSICLCLKQIHIYVAIPFFICIFLNCLYSKTGKNSLASTIRNLFFTFLSGITPFFCFFPFKSDLFQVFNRLFPVNRGLIHSYPAPNFWALYSTLDLVFNKVINNKSTGLVLGHGGDVVEFLPSPDVLFCLFLSILPCLIIGFKVKNDLAQKSIGKTLTFVIVSGLFFFYFGYHVHEKALIWLVLPLIPLFFTNNSDLINAVSILFSVGFVSIMPLFLSLFGIGLRIIYLPYFILIILFRKIIFRKQLPLFRITKFYLIGLLLVDAVFVFLYLLKTKLEFLPFLLVSNYCSFGLFISIALLLKYLLSKTIKYE
ncbi:hypothetical protein P9112_006999 [Eukaryota sp. TZLM1-RC]